MPLQRDLNGNLLSEIRILRKSTKIKKEQRLKTVIGEIRFS